MKPCKATTARLNSPNVMRLVSLGCAKGQGWHFGKPVDAATARMMVAGGPRPEGVSILRRAG